MTSSPAPATPRSSARSSALVATGIFLSRLLGLARQALMARYLGAGIASDAFNGAFRIPNLLQNLFGEGALSASFIPVYASAVARGEREEADRVAGAVAACLAMVVAVVVLLGVLATPWVVRAIAPGFTGRQLELTVSLTRILFPGAGLLVLSAWCLGVLNSHRRFFLSYAAPVVWSVAMIVVLLYHGPGTRVGDVGGLLMREAELAVALAWASVVGAFLQLAVQLPAVLSLLGRLRLRLDLGFAPVREVLRNFLPALLSRGVVQISSFIDIQLASFLPIGTVTLLGYAQSIYLLPISLFGMSVSAVELSEMSREGGAGTSAHESIRRRLDVALPRVAFFVIPSAVALFLLGRAIIGVLLEYGKFGPVESFRATIIIAGSAVGLLASALGRLYSSTCFALRDTRTPLRFAIARVLIAAALGYLFALHLPRLLWISAWTGAVGLTLSAAIAAWVEFLLLRRAVVARVGPSRVTRGALLRLWAAATAAGVAGVFAMQLLDAVQPQLRGAASLALFGLTYAGLTLALGVPDARALAARIRRR